MRKPNLFLRATLATSLVTLASSAVNGQFANGLVAHWAFDDNLDDSTATGAHGTFVPGLDNDPASYVAAKFGNGIDLNNFDRGVFDEHIDIASVPEDTFDFAGGSMTVSAWVSSSFAAENQAIVTKGEGNSWRLISSGQNASVAMHGGGLTAADDPIVDLFSDFQFHHLVGVVEAGVGVKIYVDGQLVGNTPGNPVIGNSTFNLTIGENPEAGFFRFWEGAIDDMAIWSRPLSGSEVATIYNNGTGVAIAEILNPVDSDNDGMPDFYENSNGLNPNLNDADEDLDGDGRSNLQEFQEGTNPDNPDTDGDFLTDGEEFTLGTSPTTPDTDGDKITDFEEVNGTINPFLGGVLRDPFDPLGDPAGDPTNPLDADTDDDTFDDLTEIEFKADPNDATDRPSRWQIGLKGYWKLNIDDWTNSDPDPLLRTFEDSSGRGFHGVLAGTNTTSLNNFAGPFGSSVVRFDGTDQRIVISGDPAEFDFPNGEMTVSAWFLIPGWTKNWQAIVAKGEGNNWRLHRNGASPNLAYTGGTPDLTGGPAVSTLRWHHVAATTANGMDKSLYYDGELVGTATGAALGANGNAMMISGNPDAAGEGHRSIFGAMTEVAVWCRALSGTEIRTIWNGYDGASGGATIEDLIIGLDTDGDGMSDIFELANGLDPNDATGDNGADGDLDMDGRTNLQEHDAGTPPDDADPDGDGLNDGDEFAAGTDPLNPDSDGDTLNDGDELSGARNSFLGGVLRDPFDPMSDPPGDPTDPLNRDSDGDGFSDFIEIANGSDPNDPVSTPDITIVTVLGTGTGSLLGGDLTDPEDDGDDRRDPLVPGDGLEERGWNFVNAVANEKNSFADHEAAFNIFDNKLGPGQDKWCCNARNITIEFAEPVNLTHFTVSSANDVENRDWRLWRLLGSADGINFELIHEEQGIERLWTERLQVILFNLPKPTSPYRFFRFEADTNWGDGLWQLGEVELFASSIDPPAGPALTVLPGSYDSVGQTVSVEVTGAAAGQTYHLRSSTDGENFAPLTPNFDFDEATVFPTNIPVDVGAAESLLLKIYEGPSIP